jgi:RNA polymerase sigma-70 factor, ECF subfamily
MEATIKICCQAKEKPLLALSQKATEQLKDGNRQARDIPKSVTSARVAAMAPEKGVKTPEQIEDLELVYRSQAGDTEAFDQLMTKYRTKIFAIICGMVRNEQDARDLAQEAFFKAWRSIRQFQGRSSFYTWLYRITSNVIIHSRRRRRCLEERELNDDIPSSLPTPGVNCQRIELREEIDAALAKLSPEHRAVVLLKGLEGLRYHEIAEVLNLPVGTVMSRLFHARKQLQFLLKPVFEQI